MSMSSLTRYRRIIMILGFVIFAGGAVFRWHSKRQLRAVRNIAARAQANPAKLWRDECGSYACRDFHLEEADCQRMCDQSTAAGLPGMSPEGIAGACTGKCQHEDSGSQECLAACFVLSSKELARPRH